MRPTKDFFTRDALTVAQDLLGKVLVRRWQNGTEKRWLINEVEAYKGVDDKACHCRFGKTERNKVMWEEGGLIYVYLIYGMYWMLNIVTGKKDEPQAVLIRSLKEVKGPGRVGKILELDKSFYGENIVNSQRLWIESRQGNTDNKKIIRTKRIGVDYAGEWAKKEWRFLLN